MKAFLCALLALALPLAVHAQSGDDGESHYAPAPPVEYPGGVLSLRDVTYGELLGFRPLTLDLYLPPGGGSLKPAVVFVHGGAFRHRTARVGGTFRDFPAVLASVAARGYVVASVNYRFVGEVRFPGAIQDVSMSIRWLRTHAAEYHIDPARFVLWGSSAGGHIAALIGTACGEAILETSKPLPSLPSNCVQGVIDWYGIVDPAANAAELGYAPGTGATESAYLGCDVRKCPAKLARAANALTYIDANDPPFLIQHGTEDVAVSPKQAQRLYDALRAAKVPAQITMFPGTAHGFANPRTGGADDAANAMAMEQVFKFLAERFPP